MIKISALRFLLAILLAEASNNNFPCYNYFAKELTIVVGEE